MPFALQIWQKALSLRSPVAYATGRRGILLQFLHNSMSNPKNAECTVIAGPCSIDEVNIREVFKIAEMEVKDRKGKPQLAVAGTRVVGLKSRTELDDSGKGMGMDYHAIQKNIDIMINGGCTKDFAIPPSALMAQKVNKKTGMLIATEVMMPSVQLPAFEVTPSQRCAYALESVGQSTRLADT